MNSESTSEQTIEGQATIDAYAAEVQAKFDDQEATFETTLKCQATLRAFFEKHREAIAPFHWSAYGWNDTEITFSHYKDHGKAREIARAFGKEGWVRKKDSYTCGAIDWHKDLDGCHLIIKTAEQLSPKLIDEVKL